MAVLMYNIENKQVLRAQTAFLRVLMAILSRLENLAIDDVDSYARCTYDRVDPFENNDSDR